LHTSKVTLKRVRRSTGTCCAGAATDSVDPRGVWLLTLRAAGRCRRRPRRFPNRGESDLRLRSSLSL